MNSAAAVIKKVQKLQRKPAAALRHNNTKNSKE